MARARREEGGVFRDLTFSFLSGNHRRCCGRRVGLLLCRFRRRFLLIFIGEGFGRLVGLRCCFWRGWPPTAEIVDQFISYAFQRFFLKCLTFLAFLLIIIIVIVRFR